MRNNEEHIECIQLVAFLRSKNLLFTHINNEMYTKSWSQKRKAKEEGVSGGVPDYIIFVDKKKSSVNRPVLIFIEMKKQKKVLKNGKISLENMLSEKQKIWIEALDSVADVEALVCYGFEEAKTYLLIILK